MTDASIQRWPNVTREDGIALALLSALWLIPVAVIGVAGEFALNDDWAYAKATQALLETGMIERVSWTWTPVVTHTWLGAGFASVLGFSFESLRWVGVFTGWLGLLATYGLARQVGAGSMASAIAAGAVGFNPVYMNIAFTYMTDIPFTVFCTLALIFFARGLERETWGPLAIGALLSLAAMTTRQAGLAAPLAFAAAIIVSKPRQRSSWIAAVLVCGAVVAGYTLTLEFAYGPGDAGRLFSTKNVVSVGFSDAPVYRLLRTGIGALAYFGFFLAPIALFSFGVNRRDALRVFIGAALFTALALMVLRVLGESVPPGHNIVYNFGLGPRTLPGERWLPGSPLWVWWVGTSAGFVAAFFIFAGLVLGALPRWRAVLDRPAWLLVVAFPVICLGPHLIRAPYFDRYMIPTLAPLCAALLVLLPAPERTGRARTAVAWLGVLLLGTYAVVGTRDYMERHRARTVLTDGLLAEGVEARRIDGGPEFNGWHSFERYWGGDRYHWDYVNSDEYVLTYESDLPGYVHVRSHAYAHWLPPRTETIRLLHRADAAAQAANQNSGSAPETE